MKRWISAKHITKDNVILNLIKIVKLLIPRLADLFKKVRRVMRSVLWKSVKRSWKRKKFGNNSNKNVFGLLCHQVLDVEENIVLYSITMEIFVNLKVDRSFENLLCLSNIHDWYTYKVRNSMKLTNTKLKSSRISFVLVPIHKWAWFGHLFSSWLEYEPWRIQWYYRRIGCQSPC